MGIFKFINQLHKYPICNSWYDQEHQLTLIPWKHNAESQAFFIPKIKGLLKKLIKRIFGFHYENSLRGIPILTSSEASIRITKDH